ncbi:hypothetical protein PHYPSEUDO_013341 [Phytophthora pseudosyringae]|uniref:Uncharacterized protein n=1 Tax=Phytophthora pseudosyringae TaxID=221518 RepID=A0A8T1W6X9_9STRA|nr:hypothetical protein PHYPSEUDO_013341 [Phytophthora pseudosyringae]
MQFSLNKLCTRDEWKLPSFSSMFPDVTRSRSASDALSIDASMTLGGLPPLNALNKTTGQGDMKIEDISNPDGDAAADSNEILTAFARLDAEAAESDTSLPLELQCRYRQGKCSQPRTFKKNGAMHSFCDYHRQLSVRNQRVFDQKKRRHQEPGVENQPRRSQRRSTANVSSCNDVLQQERPEVKKRPKRRRRTV